MHTSIVVEGSDSSTIKATAKERQRPTFTRDGNKQIISTKIDSLNITEILEDTQAGNANVSIEVVSKGGMEMRGGFLKLSLSSLDYSSLILQQKNYLDTIISLPYKMEDHTFEVRKMKLSGPGRTLYLNFARPTQVSVKKNIDQKEMDSPLYVYLLSGNTRDGTHAETKFSVRAVATIDNTPVSIAINTSKQGRPFDGFGGNFRLQNPQNDPQVIDYSLKNLRVAWSRVEFPWMLWQPEENIDPVSVARQGNLNGRVQKAMEMAARLYHMDIPVILSGWFPPQWAVTGKLNMRPVDGVWGNQLNPGKMTEIYKSITDYILYLKSEYDVQIAFFSFNESDLGINVRQTPQEHADLIKGLGAYFKSKGLKTKLLLGDNSDATSYEFVYPAMKDPGAIPYIGAVSFHSWRGWDKETLMKWKQIADKLRVPLIVGEGSVDAAAWNYPHIFEETFYVMEEINLYIRLLSICEPLTILQWQLTSDYSPMAGGGIFGNNGPLRPTQRFWNFRQLASTPEHLFAMPVTSDNIGITCAALGDNSRSKYAVHVVNNGARRVAVISGLPDNIKSLAVYNTSKNVAMKKEASIKVSNGKTRFSLAALSYTTFISE
ncbi:MAG: hypothetical protein ABIR19_07090 [Ginsengibacter sp.]